MKYKFITELLEAANAIPDQEQRAIFLQSNMRESVKKVLACLHNPEIEFVRPLGLKFDTHRNKMGISDTDLGVETKRLYIFQKSNPLNESRKITRLTQMLEAMPFEESSFVYNNLLTKKNPYKNLQRPFIRKYFPEILTYKIDRH